MATHLRMGQCQTGQIRSLFWSLQKALRRCSLEPDWPVEGQQRVVSKQDVPDLFIICLRHGDQDFCLLSSRGHKDDMAPLHKVLCCHEQKLLSCRTPGLPPPASFLKVLDGKLAWICKSQHIRNNTGHSLKFKWSKLRIENQEETIFQSSY